LVDYQAIKTAIKIEDVVPKLDLAKITRNGEQYRCPCPSCKAVGDRALVITPSKAAYYCFHAKRGGDVIALVAHVQGIGQREAAEWLMEQYPQQREALPPRGSSSTHRHRKGKSTAAIRLISTQQAINDNHVEAAMSLFTEVSVGRYDEMLGVVPPALMDGRGFLVGEPTDHRECKISGLFRPTFAAFLYHNGKYYESTEAMTVPEYKAFDPASL